MSNWFEGALGITCSLERVRRSLAGLGAHHLGVVKQMPGLKNVELLHEGADFVTIRTSEGLMKRTGIEVQIEADRVLMQYDEVYEAGSLVTASSHIVDEFRALDGGVEQRMTISAVRAPGFVGFFYRHLGSSNIGKALLRSSKTYLESLADGPE